MEATKQSSMYVPAGLYWTIQWEQKHAMKQPWRSVYCTITIQVKWVWSVSWLKWISHEGLCYQVCQEVWWCRWCCWGFSEEDLLEDKQRGHSHPNRILLTIKICCRKHKGSQRIASGIENMLPSTLRQDLLHGMPSGTQRALSVFFNPLKRNAGFSIMI